MSFSRTSFHLVDETASERAPHGLSPEALSRSTHPDQTIAAMLDVVREFTDADVVFVGEFRGGRQIIRWSNGDSVSFGFHAGVGLPLDETFCSRLMTGEIQAAIPDVRKDPVTRDLAFTQRASVGSYVGVPLRLSDDRLFGTLCALTHEPRPATDRRHHHLMEMIGPLLADQIERAESQTLGLRARFDRIRHVLDAANSVRVALQPIVDLDSREAVGYEALMRFADGRSPDHWFAEAWQVELGMELEVLAFLGALRAMDDLSAQMYLSVNTSPAMVIAADLAADLDRLAVDGSRLVLELTEHAEIVDYDALINALKPLRERGVRIAVDDAGAGFASLRHVLNISPDMIKLDVSLTRGIETDPARTALVSLFASFAARIGAIIVAEGIETDLDLNALRSVGITFGQGYLLGRPTETSHGRVEVWEMNSLTHDHPINARYLR